MAKVTAVLLSYKRKPNMPLIIEAIRRQTVPAEIWVINNDGTEDFGADRPIAIPWNAGEWARYVFAARVETEYCMFQDDDFMLSDKYFLEDAIATHRANCPEFLLGVSGRQLQQTPPHYSPDVTSGYAAILKGHFQLFRPEVARSARIPQHPSASDIFWSLDIGRGDSVHYVSHSLKVRLDELNRHGVGYEFRPEHYQEREAVCAAWLKEVEYA